MLARHQKDLQATAQLKRTSQKTPRLGLVKGIRWGTHRLGLALAGRRVGAGVCQDQAEADLETPAGHRSEKTHLRVGKS